MEEKQEERNKESNVIEDFRMRYQITMDDIKYIKSRQWVVTYYLLLLFVAIIGFYKIISPEHGTLPCWQRAILFMIPVGIAVLGIWFLYRFQKTLARFRTYLIDGILPNLSENFKNAEVEELKARFGKKKWCRKYTSKWRNFSSHTLWFMLMLVGGVFFVFWYFFLASAC